MNTIMQKQVHSKVINTACLLLTLFSMNAEASFFDSRVKKWEIYLAPQVTNSKDIHYGNGAELNIEKDSSLGFLVLAII